jgi:hypothetical protein
MYRESRPSQFMEKKFVVKKVIPEKFAVGTIVLNRELDKKGRQVHVAPEIKYVEIWGQRFRTKLYELEYGDNNYGYVAITSGKVGNRKSRKLYGVGTSKRKAWKNLEKAIEGFVFENFATTTIQD